MSSGSKRKGSDWKVTIPPSLLLRADEVIE